MTNLCKKNDKPIRMLIAEKLMAMIPCDNRPHVAGKYQPRPFAVESPYHEDIIDVHFTQRTGPQSFKDIYVQLRQDFINIAPSITPDNKFYYDDPHFLGKMAEKVNKLFEDARRWRGLHELLKKFKLDSSGRLTCDTHGVQPWHITCTHFASRHATEALALARNHGDDLKYDYVCTECWKKSDRGTIHLDSFIAVCTKCIDSVIVDPNIRIRYDMMYDHRLYDKRGQRNNPMAL